ncbi:SRPBCC domain-containing protein [Algoriphagus aestuariicola]|uniref:SRPBCC domain-containing protein n=1 Tax=Algoriphagus aestuariicola TaxID=1852016 RepID=A0ABS3BNC8_9BACT|nr:SRPBCC domain-containing protein [Algoriphagus aestuariicola]MBN7800314.1 SRPBCC domain-containing protein [Algoriphagus aestuariicola]
MEIEEKNSWSSFIVSMPINMPGDAISNAWTSQDGLESWFLRLAEFSSPEGTVRDRNESIQIGDHYKWIWHGWSDEIVENGEILKPENGEIIRFTFGKAGIVSVKTSQKGSETILQLTQEQIPIDEDAKLNFHVGCKTGWTFYLLNLKSILLGGLDLRNKNNELNMD